MATAVHVLAVAAGRLRKPLVQPRRASGGDGAGPRNALRIERFDLRPIPLSDGDVEAVGLPDAVLDVRRRIAAADALRLATPEGDHSVSGVLQTPIDWASRRPGPALRRKARRPPRRLRG